MNHTFTKGFAAGAATIVVGLAIFGGLSGFQANSPKVGVVNMGKVFESSEAYKKAQDQIRALMVSRNSTLEFLALYRSMKREDAQRFADLSSKNVLTDAEKAELEKIKISAQDAEKRKKELEVKNPLTPDETKALEEFRIRQTATGELFQKLGQAYNEEYEAYRLRSLLDAEASVKALVNDYAKKQGFSMVYLSSAVQYAANDLTEESIKLAAKAKIP